MATVQDILNFTRAQAQTNSDGLSDSNGIIFSNEALADFHRRLVARGVDASQLQEAYRDGTANIGTYLYETDQLFLKAIEVNYTDTNTNNYLLATQVDVSNIPAGQSFSWLRNNQSTQFPLFDDRGDWFEIFPTPTGANNLTNLIRIFYFKKPTEYTAVGDTVSYPASLDYRTFGWRVGYSYLKSLGKIIEANEFNKEYLQRVDEYISTLSRGAQQPLQATPIQLSGWNF
jgi:hypothetical protein